jgi:hypothetical protein
MSRHPVRLRGAVLTLLFGLVAANAAEAGHAAAKREGGSTVKPQVVVLLELPASDEPQRARLGGELQRSLRGRKLSAELVGFSSESLDGAWPQPSQCSDSECQAELCQKSELRQLLSVRIVREGEDYQLSGQLYDAAMADFAAEVQASCVGCNPSRLATKLGGMTGDLVHKALQRKTGLLEVTSQPPGAMVRLNGMRLGQTPLVVTTFAGEHRIEVLKSGFVRYKNEVVVEAGRGAALDAFLVVEPGAQQSSEQSLPRRAELWLRPAPESQPDPSTRP